MEQLRLVLAELQVATLKHTVHVNAAEFIGMLIHGKTFTNFPISASRSLQCWTIWCGGQMSLKPGGNRQRTQSPLEPDSSISLTCRQLMRWFVLRLFADLFFRLDDLIEAIAVVGVEESFFASGHSFVARRQ